MQRNEFGRARRVLRRLRKHLCLCVTGEQIESGSEYTLKERSVDGFPSPSSPFSPVPARLTVPPSSTGGPTAYQPTTTANQATTTVDQATATLEQATATKSSCTVTATVEKSPVDVIVTSQPDECEASMTGKHTTRDWVMESLISDLLDRVIGRDEVDVHTSRTCDHLVEVGTEETIAATDVAAHELIKDGTEVATDEVLKQTVTEFVENLMESVLSGMDNESSPAAILPVDQSSMLDTQSTVHGPGISTAESELSESTVESSVTEFYSCVSESVIPTDTSHFCSLTSFSSTEEPRGTEDRNEAFLTPQQSCAEPSVTLSLPELATACPDDVSSFSLNETGDEHCTSSSSDISDGTQLKSTQCCGQSNTGLDQRSECRVFQVKLVRGMVGLGLTLGSDDLKEVAIKKIGTLSSAAVQGELGVGDRILEINGKSVIGKSPSQAQRLLSETKWGEEVTILAMPPQETVIFHYSETTNAGVIVMKLNTSFDKPLGVEVEGGSDTESPYIRISAIKPGSLAERSRMLRVGDELVEVDRHLMVGITHDEATDILGHIYKPITLIVQRRKNLNIMDRVQSGQTLNNQ